MNDPSFGVARLPAAGDPLDYKAANAIEENLRALILAWPEFISKGLLYSVGSYGYLQLDEQSSVAPGVEVDTLRYLPRLLVLLTGDGLGNLSWTGEGWTEENGVLVYTMPDPGVESANAALRKLVFSATGDVDAVVVLAGEHLGWEPESLRLIGEGRTKLLFHARASWGLARAKKLTWGGAKPLTWGQAAQLRKDS